MDRLDYLSEISVDTSVMKYIKNNLSNITISIADEDKIPAWKMCGGRLDGWCWQSSTFLSIFFLDSDKVTRGELSLYEKDLYNHSWIEFNYENKDYIFDPSLNIICDKENYYQVFNVRNTYQVETSRIKMELVDLLSKKEKDLLYIAGTNNLSDTFYRINSEVSADIEEEKIKKINIRFYFQD